jgi:hypothetical protein
MKRFISLALFLVASSSFAGVVQPLGASPQVLIPAAGNAQGANGTFFKSDISIINLASHDQVVALQWLPEGVTSTVTPLTITMPARTGLRSADFVHDYFGQTGLGSIIVTGVTGAGTVDSTAALYVNARIWTPEPGTAGTTSQSFPAVPLSLINTPVAALFAVGGADDAANYRVNVGIVNVDPSNTQTFVVTLPGTTTQTFTVTIPPMSMQQISLGSNVSSTAQISIQNATPSATHSNSWLAYGSTIDNVTGDAWSELAVVGTGTTP